MADINFALTELGAEATASATDGTYAPALAIDGNDLTYWQSTTAVPVWLVVDLGAPKYLESVEVHLAVTGGTWSAVTREYSQDGQTWFSLSTGGSAGAGAVTWPLEGLTLRYFRIGTSRAVGSYRWQVRYLRLIGPTEAPPPVEDPSCTQLTAWLDGLEANWVPCVAAWLANNP